MDGTSTLDNTNNDAIATVQEPVYPPQPTNDTTTSRADTAQDPSSQVNTSNDSEAATSHSAVAADAAAGDTAMPPDSCAPASSGHHGLEPASSSSSPSSPRTPTAMTPAMQTRLGITRRLLHGLSQLRGRNRLVLLAQGALALSQVAIFTAILVISRNDACSKPLRTYLAIHVARVAVAFPLTFYIALAPAARPPRGQNDTPERRDAREARRVMGNPVLDARVRSVSDLLSLFMMIWFVLGNLWVYSSLGSTECRSTSPKLWWSSFATLLLAYVRIAEILLIVFAVVFFLPMVILGLRLFGGLEKKHEIGPLTKEEIAKLPVVLYVPKPEEEGTSKASDIEQGKSASATNADGDAKAEEQRTEQSPAYSAHPPAPSTGTTKRPRRRQVLRLFFRRNRGKNVSSSESASSNGEYIDTPYPLYPLPENLSSCPICLCDYDPPPLRSAPAEEQTIENLEPLNLLPCKHALHKDCLGPWLQTSGRCPVCQQAIFPEKQEQGKKTGRRRARSSVANGSNPAAASTGASLTAPVTTPSTNNANRIAEEV